MRREERCDKSDKYLCIQDTFINCNYSGRPVFTNPGSSESAMHCAYCPSVLAGEEEMQEHINSQHVSQSGDTLRCPLCPTALASQRELQEHLLSYHVETAEEQASTSRTVRSSATTTVHSIPLVRPVDQVLEQPFSNYRMCCSVPGHELKCHWASLIGTGDFRGACHF